MTVQTMQEHEAVTLHFGENDFRRRGLNALARRFVRGEKVLDMRCLAGHLVVSLAQDGKDVTGLDAYGPAIELTQQACVQAGVKARLLEWKLDDLVGTVENETFDCVLCLDVLNHVSDDVATMEQISRVVRPGGRLVLLVPALKRLLGKRDENLGHLRRYEREELRHFLATHGFEVTTLRFWNTLPLPAQFVWEHVLGRELKDTGRYGPPTIGGNALRRLASSWYLAVENHIPFPIGLSLFAVATRK